MKSIWSAFTKLFSMILSALLITGFVLLALWLFFPLVRDYIVSPGFQPEAVRSPAGSTGSVTYEEAVQAISLISEKAINAATHAVTTMNIMVVVMVTIAIAVFSYLTNRQKLSADQVDRVQKNLDNVVDKLDESRKEISTISNRYIDVQEQLLKLPGKILPIEFAAQAYESGKISKVEFDESYAWLSWQKWIFTENETGYQELLRHKSNSDGLPVSIRLSAIAELHRIEEKCRTPGAGTDKDFATRDKLRRLLNITAGEVG